MMKKFYYPKQVIEREIVRTEKIHFWSFFTAIFLMVWFFFSCSSAPASVAKVQEVSHSDNYTTQRPTPAPDKPLDLPTFKIFDRKLLVMNWMTAICVIDGNPNPDCVKGAMACIKTVNAMETEAIEKAMECGIEARQKATTKESAQ